MADEDGKDAESSGGYSDPWSNVSLWLGAEIDLAYSFSVWYDPDGPAAGVAEAARVDVVVNADAADDAGLGCCECGALAHCASGELGPLLGAMYGLVSGDAWRIVIPRAGGVEEHPRLLLWVRRLTLLLVL